MESRIEFPQKFKIGPLYDPEITLLGIYLNEIKSWSCANISTPIFIVASLTIAKTLKKLVSIHGWMDEENIFVPHKGVLFSHKKEGKTAYLQQRRWILIALCCRNKSEREKQLWYGLIY